MYRIAGLAPGEYATQANLSVSDRESTFGPMPGNPGTTIEMQMLRVRFSLPLYSGDVLRKSDAKAYTLGSGEVRAGSDLVFPLAKLHRVTKQVVAKDGHPVNSGTVSLRYADDQDEMTETNVLYDEAAFHLEFVPEGDFLLKVRGAKDVSKVQVANPAGYTPRFHQEEKTLRTYGDAEQPLVVKGDMTDVIAGVPEGKGPVKHRAPWLLVLWLRMGRLAMRFELFIAMRYLRAKRRQAVIGVVTAISVIGVAAGVASLIIALAITNGMKRDLEARLLGSTAHVSLMRVAADGMKDWQPLLERLRHLPHVTAAAPGLYEQVLISRGRAQRRRSHQGHHSTG